MGSDRRAVSTVADVSLGLLLIVAAMGVLVTFAETGQSEHDPIDTEYTAQTLTASTTNTTYTVSEAVDEHYRDHRTDDNPYDETELTRVSHGPIATQIADVAVANASLGGHHLSNEAVGHEAALEEELQTQLVGSRYETSISAVWEPVEGATLRGETVHGQHPPPAADVSTTTLTVSSGVPDAREEALDAVEGDEDYGAVAQAVANATVAGSFPELETQRALEGDGVGSDLTRYRYERVATVLDGNRSIFERTDWLSPSSANAEAANDYLATRLAATLESQLEAEHGETYESASEAARTVSTGTVTITIRTWSHE